MVNTSCAVFQCSSSSHRHKGLRFHQFPRDERLQTWVKACKRSDLLGKDVEQLKNMHVCSMHFEHRMYGKLLLKKSAVPTLNLPALRTSTVSTQTDNPDAHMPLHIMTSQGVQTDGTLDKYPRYVTLRHITTDDVTNPRISIEQFLYSCEVLLPNSVCNFVKTYIISRQACA